MEERIISRDIGDGIAVHVIPAEKFKTIEIGIFIHNELNNDYTKNALLGRMMRRGTEKLPTTRQLEVFLENLYGARFGAQIMKKGERHIIKVSLSMVSQKYTDKGDDLLIKGLELLKDVIFKPAKQKGLDLFPEEYLDQEKANLKKQIKSLINNKVEYAVERCFQEMCKNERFGKYVYGNIDHVDQITNDHLFNYYQAMINTSPMDIFIVGDINPDKIINMVKQIFDIKRSKIKSIPKEVVKRTVGGEKYYFEKLDVTQGKLSLGYRTNTDYRSPAYVPLVVFNSILGGGTHSKLFIHVREKNSLAYYIFSRLEKFKGLMIISSGIETDNYQKALDIIKQQVSEIKEGNISDEELEFSKKTLVTHLKNATDSPAMLMDYYLGNSIKGVDMSISSFIDRIKQVDKEQVRKAADAVELDTVYFLTNN